MSTHGGKRAGAGRPTKSESGAAIPVTIKLAPDVLACLYAVAAELELTHAEIVEVGVRALVRRAERKSKKLKEHS